MNGTDTHLQKACGKEPTVTGSSDDPISCRVTWAGVLHIELEDIPRLLEAINEIPSARLVYQTKGIGLYHIVKG